MTQQGRASRTPPGCETPAVGDWLACLSDDRDEIGELQLHLEPNDPDEQQADKNRRAGMAPDEARRQALLKFGGVQQVREQTRDEFRAAPDEKTARLRALREAASEPAPEKKPARKARRH